MKRFLVLLLVVPFLLAGCAAEDKDVIAIVNGEEVYEEEYEIRVERLKNQVAQVMPVDFDSPEGQEWIQIIEGRILDELIWETILLQEAETHGIEASEAEVDQAFDEALLHYDTEEEFDAFLEENDMTRDDYRDLVRTQVIVENLLDKQVGEPDVDEEQARAYYEQNRAFFVEPEQVAARHLLYAEEEEAEAVLEDIEDEDDFARYFEEDGEELGFFQEGQMTYDFEDAAFDMEVGEIRGPVETQFGHHIIYVYDRKESYEPEYEEVRDEIIMELGQDEWDQKVNEYFEKLYEDSEVELIEPEEEDDE